MAKHLGMSERTMIEKGLILGNSFQVIGRMIGRAPTTVSREVKKRRAFLFLEAATSVMIACISTAACERTSVQKKRSTVVSADVSSARSMTAVSIVGTTRAEPAAS